MKYNLLIEWLGIIKMILGIILILLAFWDITRGEILLAILTGIMGILMLLSLFLNKKRTGMPWP